LSATEPKPGRWTDGAECRARPVLGRAAAGARSMPIVGRRMRAVSRVRATVSGARGDADPRDGESDVRDVVPSRREAVPVAADAVADAPDAAPDRPDGDDDGPDADGGGADGDAGGGDTGPAAPDGDPDASDAPAVPANGDASAAEASAAGQIGTRAAQTIVRPGPTTLRLRRIGARPTDVRTVSEPMISGSAEWISGHAQRSRCPPLRASAALNSIVGYLVAPRRRLPVRRTDDRAPGPA
jgi:hypothetical protein